MSLLTGLSRLFGNSRARDDDAHLKGHGTRTATRARGSARAPAPGRPVVIDYRHDEDGFGIDADFVGAVEPDDDLKIDPANNPANNPGNDSNATHQTGTEHAQPSLHGAARFLPAARSRQELIADLQKRYSEVVELMNKLDGHLDEQAKRQERLLEIAETVPDALAELPRLNEQTKRLIDATSALAEATSRGQNRADAAMERQKSVLEELVTHTAHSSRAQSQVVGSLSGLSEGVAQMNSASEQLGVAMLQLREHESDRDTALTQAVTDQRRLTSIAAAASIAAALSVIALVILIATGVV